MKLGLSGFLTRAFIRSPLTPLLLLAAIVVGGIALIALPREEEPQISVPMVDILVTANGYKADNAVELITKPLEDIIKGVNGVEHVYSSTQDKSGRRHRALLCRDRRRHGADARPREDPRQHRRPAERNSRAADHRARHQRRRDRHLDANAEAATRPRAGTTTVSTRSPRSCSTSSSKSTMSA